MLIREMYAEAIAEEFHSLVLLIEFLIFEKKVITFDDHKSALDLYFKPNNRSRMNSLLLEYRDKMKKLA